MGHIKHDGLDSARLEARRAERSAFRRRWAAILFISACYIFGTLALQALAAWLGRVTA